MYPLPIKYPSALFIEPMLEVIFLARLGFSAIISLIMITAFCFILIHNNYTIYND